MAKMMDAVRKTADFAENQTKFLLKDLNSQNHSTRLKGVKRYQDYILSSRPDMYEDVVDYLFLGNNEYNGLLKWCGFGSSNHGGQLKRICSDVISLIKILITLEPDEYGENIFFDRFMKIPVNNLREMNFSKHISPEGTSNFFSSTSRSGNVNDAFEILSLILEFHVNADDEPEPVDLNYLLQENVQSLESFRAWLRHSAAEEMKRTETSKKKTKVIARPTKWSEVRLKCVPLQPDEEGFGNEEDMTIDEYSHTVPDPLGLSSVDLLSLQAAHVTSFMTSEEDENNITSSSTSRKRRGRASSVTAVQRLGLMKIVQESINNTQNSTNPSDIPKNTALSGDDDDEFDIDFEDNENLPTRSRHSNAVQGDVQMASILPSEKNFHPDLFLSIVHGTCSKNDLSRGLANLQSRLTQQSSRREDLVRQHYGLFIHCVDGLEWLKSFHENSVSKDNDPTKSVNPSRKKSLTSGILLSSKKLATLSPKTLSKSDSDNQDESIENPMRKALLYLGKAKDEAQNTLAPILSRMHRARQLKNADQILRRLLSTLEYPYAMQQMLVAGDYQNVLSIYKRVQSLPATSGLRIVKRIISRSDAIMFDMKQKLLSILLNPTPVLPVLTKIVKILREMEDEESCRVILQQCFDKQIQTFEEQMKTNITKSCEELMRAFMKGQEINMMNKDPSLRATDNNNNNNNNTNNNNNNNNNNSSTKGIFSDGRNKNSQSSTSSYLFNDNNLGNINNNANNGNGNGNNNGRRRTAASIRSAATKRRQSQNAENMANEAMKALTLYGNDINDGLYDPDRNSNFSSDDYGLNPSNGLDYEDDDTDYDINDDLSDTGSVMSNETTNSKKKYNTTNKKEISYKDDELYQDPSIDYCDYFCNKVRVKMTRSLIDIIDMWLPSVHRLLILLTAPSQGNYQPLKSSTLNITTNNSTTTTATTTATTITTNTNTSTTITSSSAISTISTSTTPIGVSITGRKVSGINTNRTLQTTYGRNQSVATQAKQLGDVLVTCTETIRGSILGFKGKYGSNLLNEILSKSIFAQEFMQNTLKEPHLTTTVMEISEVYDVIETVLMDRNDNSTPNLTFATDDLDSINFFGSSAYRDSIYMLRALAEDGEITITKKSMEQLITNSLVLSSKISKNTLINGSSYSTQFNFSLSNEKSNFIDDVQTNGLDVKTYTIDDVVRMFESMTIKKLRRIQDTIRRTDWVAPTVWENIQRLLDRFIASLAIIAGANTDPTKRTIDRSDTQDESDTNEYKIRMSLELEMLEISLSDTQHVQLIKNQNLDFIRACVRLRTQTVANLWNETKNLFPLENITRNREDSTPLPMSVVEVRRRSRTGLYIPVDIDSDSSVSPATNARKNLGNERLKSLEKTIEDRILLSVGSISVMEENAVVKYLELMLLYFRTIIHASYSVVVKAEMGSTLDRLRSSKTLPSHLSRILLELEFIQAELITKLSGLTVAASIGQKKLNGDSKLFADTDVRSWVTDQTKYENFLFHIICISVLDVYATLVESLAINAFSLHSTGRKPISRRLSSISKQSSMDGIVTSVNSPSKEDSKNVEQFTCKYLYSCAQSLEEFDFLLMALKPLVLSESEIPTINCREHVLNQINKRKDEIGIVSKDIQLWKEARLFVEAVRNKSSGRYVHQK